MPSQQNASGCLPKTPNLPQMPQQEESFTFSSLLQAAGLTLIPIATKAGSWLLFSPSREQMRWQVYLKKPPFSIEDPFLTYILEICCLLPAGFSLCSISNSPAGSLKSTACVLFGVTMATTVGATFVYNKVKKLEYWAAAASLMFVSTAVTNGVFFYVDQAAGWFLLFTTTWRAYQMLDVGAIYLLNQHGGDEKKKQKPRKRKRGKY